MKETMFFIVVMCTFFLLIFAAGYADDFGKKSGITHIDLPEGICLAERGDSLVLFDSARVEYLYFYHSRTDSSLPEGAKVLTVK